MRGCVSALCVYIRWLGGVEKRIRWERRWAFIGAGLRGCAIVLAVSEFGYRYSTENRCVRPGTTSQDFMLSVARPILPSSFARTSTRHEAKPADTARIAARITSEHCNLPPLQPAAHIIALLPSSPSQNPYEPRLWGIQPNSTRSESASRCLPRYQIIADRRPSVTAVSRSRAEGAREPMGWGAVACRREGEASKPI